MSSKRVKAGQRYIFYPNLLDRFDARSTVVPGTIVKVINLPGAPKANTMGHAHVAVELDGKWFFAGLFHTNSLHPLADRKLVIDAIRADIARQQAVRS